MARIPLPSVEEFTPEQRKVYEAVVAGPRGVMRGPLRAVIHRAELADKWQQLGEILRYRTSLGPRLSELVILATARHWDSQFEWHAHVPPARKGGVKAEVIEAIRQGKRPVLEHDDEKAVYEYATELLTRHVVSDATYQKALAQVKTVGIVELTALIGYYSMVAMTLNAHQILPEGEQPLPSLR